MPKKKKPEENRHKANNPDVMGLPRRRCWSSPLPIPWKINYMPYAMSVIVSRAIPEIDGFKPSHRKLLYTMYKMGLLTGARTKSANIVGQTMRLNPHGDAAIYDTMVRLSRGYGALLHPLCGLQGQLRQGLLPGHGLGRLPVHRGQAGPHLRGAVPGYRQRHRGLCGQLRQHHEGAGPAAHHLPQHSGQSANQRHRRGHGLPVLRLQPEGGLRHHHRLSEEPGLRPDGDPARPRISPPAAS